MFWKKKEAPATKAEVDALSAVSNKININKDPLLGQPVDIAAAGSSDSLSKRAAAVRPTSESGITAFVNSVTEGLQSVEILKLKAEQTRKKSNTQQ